MRPDEILKEKAEKYATKKHESITFQSEEEKIFSIERLKDAFFEGYSLKQFELLQELASSSKSIIEKYNEDSVDEDLVDEDCEWYQIEIFQGKPHEVQSQVNYFIKDMYSRYVFKVISTQQSFVGTDSDGCSLIVLSILYTTD